MRIDFQSNFKQVSRLVNTAADVSSGSGTVSDFDSTLASLTNQIPESTKDLQAIPGEKSAPVNDLLASLNFGQPSTRSAPLTQFPSQLLESIPDQNSGAGVKTPTVFDVRRITAPADSGYTERMKKVAAIVTQAGKDNGIDPALGMAVASTESSFNPKAVSSDGNASKGLFQLLDDTGKQLHEESGADTKYDPFNPGQNVSLGIQYLRKLHETFSHETKLPNNLESVAAANSASLEKLAVAAFNAGESRVAAAQARAKSAGHDPADYDQVATYLPKSTQEYVTRVLQTKTQFGGRTFG